MTCGKYAEIEPHPGSLPREQPGQYWSWRDIDSANGTNHIVPISRGGTDGRIGGQAWAYSRALGRNRNLKAQNAPDPAC